MKNITRKTGVGEQKGVFPLIVVFGRFVNALVEIST